MHHGTLTNHLTQLLRPLRKSVAAAAAAAAAAERKAGCGSEGHGWNGLRCCLATIEQSQAQRWWDFVVGGVDCLCAGDGPVQTRTYGNKTRNMAIS